MTATRPLEAPAVISRLKPFSTPRTALVHYWLVSMRGGERVLERMLGLYPGADIFTHVYDASKMSRQINSATVRTSYVDRLPFSRKLYQYYLPLMPSALEELDLTPYDLVVSSEAGPAKGVITRPDALHVCYCHSPMRYIWDQYHQYRASAGLLPRIAMPFMYHRLRQWDVNSSARVDRFAANSHYIGQRIRKVWRREAEIIHPPVEVGLYGPTDNPGETYLWVGQFVPYKRPDLAVDAFNASGRKLLMVGTGGMAKELRACANANITILDRLDFTALRRAFAECRALLMTAEEDFGITPVEAMASGRPVIAYGRGGARDTVIPQETGLFFNEQTPESLNETLDDFETFLPHFDPAAAVAQAQNFAPEIFDRKMRALTEV